MSKYMEKKSRKLGWWDGYWDGLCESITKCASFVGTAAMVVGSVMAIRTQIAAN